MEIACGEAGEVKTPDPLIGTNGKGQTQIICGNPKKSVKICGPRGIGSIFAKGQHQTIRPAGLLVIYFLKSRLERLLS